MIRTVTGDIANITGSILCREHFFPMLRERGVGAAQIDVMMCRNPQRLLNFAF
jgi:predicted metal-dependent phosphotriesterase family hydrolase